MDDIDRYVRTLRLLLPRAQRDDIVRELSEEIAAQLAEREAALGRPLDARERAALIGQFGHPLVTAARYWPARHLIGPVIFPYYWIALKTALALIAIGHLLGAAVPLAGGGPVVPVGALIENAIANALKVAAWLTALAALAEVCLVRSGMLEKWEPRAASPLPPFASRVVARALAHVPVARRTRAACPPGELPSVPSAIGLMIGAGVGLWWLAGLRFPSLFFGPGAAGLEWGPAMDRMYPVLVVAQLTMFAEQLLRYLHREQTGLERATRWAWSIAGVFLIYLVATSDHQWMIWGGDAAARAGAIVARLGGREIALREFVNGIWSIVFVLVAAASVIGFVKAFTTRLRGTPLGSHA